MGIDCGTVNWGSVADWVSGIGSLSAAGMALYLAKSSQKIRLKGFCGLRVIVGGGMPQTDVLSINVTNIGTRSTVVNNITMSVGRWRKRYAVITVVRDAYSVGVPYALADGQVAHWGIPLGDNNEWMRGLCRGFVTSESDVRSLLFFVHTNHGEKLKLAPETEFLNSLSSVLLEEKKKLLAG